MTQSKTKNHETNNTQNQWLKENPYLIFLLSIKSEIQINEIKQQRRERQRYPSCCWEASGRWRGEVKRERKVLSSEEGIREEDDYQWTNMRCHFKLSWIESNKIQRFRSVVENGNCHCSRTWHSPTKRKSWIIRKFKEMNPRHTLTQNIKS